MNENRFLIDDTKNSDPKANSAILYIELYLVVLAFFILLNALSKIDEVKKVQAVDSVQEHFFNYEVTIETLGAEYKKPTGQSDFSADFITQHSSDIRLERLDFIRTGNVLLSRNNINNFFGSNSPTVQDPYLEWLDRLAFVLRDDADSVNYSVQISIGSYVFLRKDKVFDSKEPILDVKRLSNIASILVSLGVEQRDIHIGITKDHPGEIRFTLSVKPETPYE